MKSNTGNEQATYVSASLIALSNMSEFKLRELLNLVGIETIRELLKMESLRFEFSYAEMAEEICTYIGWEPALSPLHLDTCLLDKLGEQVVGISNLPYYAGESIAHQIFTVLCSPEIQDLIDASDSEIHMPQIDERDLVW